MDAEDYRAEVLRCYMWASLLVAAPLEELREAQRHAENIGWFLDPTAYRNKAQALDEDSRLTAILADAKRRLLAELPGLAKAFEAGSSEKKNATPHP